MPSDNWDNLVEFTSKNWMLRKNDLIGRDTRLQDDLDMKGEGAEEFMGMFIENFKIKYNKLTFHRYFDEDFGAIYPSILRLFGRYNNEPKIPITLGDLEDAIATGELNDEVLMNKYRIG